MVETNIKEKKKITDEYLENFLKIIVVQCLKSVVLVF